MVAAKYIHDPAAVLDYALDWTDYLAAADNDTLTASTWTVYDTAWNPITGDDPTIAITDSTFNNQTAVVWIDGGTAVAGQKFYVTNHVTTVGGRQDDRTIQISIKQE